MLSNPKANIISNVTRANFVKINRVIRPHSQTEVYDIDCYSFFKLVDAVTRGNIINYVDYIIFGTLVGVDPVKSSNMMVEVLMKKLKPIHFRQLFGNILIKSSDDLKRYLNKCPDFKKSIVEAKLKQYIKNNFDIVNGKFKRKLTSQYINV